MRKKTRQELRAESPDHPISKKKKIHKPFIVQRRLINPTHVDFLDEILGVWHGNHKCATMELAEAYVAKQQRANHLVRYKFRIVSKDT